MIKRGTLVWMALAIAAGIGLFLLKYEVSAMEDRLAQIQRDTKSDLAAIHVLRAEWSYLNQPARLDDLGRRLLLLEPVSSNQSVTVNDIPFRPDPVKSADPGATVPPAADHDPPPETTSMRVP